MRVSITANAYKDIVESRRYNYQSFVKFVLENSMITERAATRNFVWDRFFFRFIRFAEVFSWFKVALFRSCLNLIPRQLIKQLF